VPLASSVRSTVSAAEAPGVGVFTCLNSQVYRFRWSRGVGVTTDLNRKLTAAGRGARQPSDRKRQAAASDTYLAAAVESLSAIRLSQRKCAATPDQNVLCSA